LFGLHDDGTIQGVSVPWVWAKGDAESVRLKRLRETQDKQSDQWKTTIKAEGFSGMFSDFHN
jgi:hypothetical protein